MTNRTLAQTAPEGSAWEWSLPLASSGSTVTLRGAARASPSLRSAFSCSARRMAGSMSAASELSTVSKSSSWAMRSDVQPAQLPSQAEPAQMPWEVHSSQRSRRCWSSSACIQVLSPIRCTLLAPVAHKADAHTHDSAVQVTDPRRIGGARHPALVGLHWPLRRTGVPGAPAAAS